VGAELRAELKRRGVPGEIVETSHSENARDLARSAQSAVVVAVGGDGTVNEVANGLVGTNRILGVLPAGSGNDFRKAIDVPGNWRDALKVLLAEKTSNIDVGLVECSASPDASAVASNSHKRYFVNGVGVGFDALVADQTRKIKHLRGAALYVLAVLQTINKYKAPTFTVSIDGASSESRNLLIAIGNGRCAGGGFYLTPHARVDDGLLDICRIDNLSILKILNLMPKVMGANHLGSKGVSYANGRTILISSKGAFFVHADGEIIGENSHRVKTEIREKALNVIVGK